jgi:hypothetical protein
MAREYTIRKQRDRRNLTDADILRCVAALDERRRAGRPEKTTATAVVSGPSSAQTAHLLGVSPDKVERARTVLDHAAEAVINSTVPRFSGWWMPPCACATAAGAP